MSDYPTPADAQARYEAALAAVKAQSPELLTPDDVELLLVAAQRDGDAQSRALALAALESLVSMMAMAKPERLVALAQTCLIATHITGDPNVRSYAEKLLAAVQSLRGAMLLDIDARRTATYFKASWILDDQRYLDWAEAGLRLGANQPRQQDVEVDRALLDAYERTGRSGYLTHARQDADRLPEPTAPIRQTRLQVRAAEWLGRMSIATGNAGYRARAGAILHAVQGQRGVAPGGPISSAFALACLRVAEEPVHIVIPGAPDDPRTQALLLASLKVNHWHRLAQVCDPDRDADLLDTLGYFAGPQPTAYVCFNFTCSQPLTDPAQIAEAVTRLANAGAGFAALGGDTKPAPGPAPFLNLGGGLGGGPMLGFGLNLGGGREKEE